MTTMIRRKTQSSERAGTPTLALASPTHGLTVPLASAGPWRTTTTIPLSRYTSTEEDPLADAEYETIPDVPIPVLANFADLFEIRKVLGQGGFGRTYKVIDRATGKRYALKILLHADPDILRDEVDALRQLSAYPECRARVVCYYGAFAIAARVVGGHAGQEWVYAILSQFIKGPTLSAELDRYQNATGDTQHDRGMAPCAALPLIVGLLKALAVVHAAGFAHHDIKPDNVILNTKTGDVVLIDFGLACRVSDAGGAHEPDVCSYERADWGTAGYLAPELLTKQGQRDAVRQLGGFGRMFQAADMYATGATLFSLLTGRVLPEYTENPQFFAEDGIENELEIAGIDPISCEGVLTRRLLSLQPAARPTVDRALREAQRCARSCRPLDALAASRAALNAGYARFGPRPLLDVAPRCCSERTVS